MFEGCWRLYAAARSDAVNNLTGLEFPLEGRDVLSGRGTAFFRSVGTGTFQRIVLPICDFQ